VKNVFAMLFDPKAQWLRLTANDKVLFKPSRRKFKMKKLVICAIAVFAVAMMIPGAQASTKCYHLTNFCDGVQATYTTVGGIQHVEESGQWDWVCAGAGVGSFTAGGTNKFGSAPYYPMTSGGTFYGFAANFTFKPSALAFDLYGTFDGATPTAFQTSQPYTVTNGACSPLGPKAPGQKSALGIR
jgi:hypothetical protein